jgi:hypothetical protein
VKLKSCQTSNSNIEDKQRGTERNSPIGEYSAGSFVFCSFGGSTLAPASGESEGAAPKSRSIGDRESANVIGDWPVISVFCSGSNAKWSRAYRRSRTQTRVVVLRRLGMK